MTGNGREKMGISGRIAQAFLKSEITPLLALTGLLLGLFAVLITPREEEPQINVTFANVFIPFPGASAREVESLVTTPAEQIVSEIEGVKHIYSTSAPGMSMLTVRFKVGELRTDAIVRLYNAFYSNQDWLPQNLGVGMPLIKPKGIDDVPIVAGTLWSNNPDITATDLLKIAGAMETELQRVPGTRDIETIGGPDRVVKVLFDPQRLAGFGLTLDDLRMALGSANASKRAGALVDNELETRVQAGTFLTRPDEIADLVVGVRNDAPVFLRDVADVSLGADTPESYVSFGGRSNANNAQGRFPAVTLTVSKKPGENAVEVAQGVIDRFEQMRGVYIPDGVEATITRNYGATAEEKAQTLIKKLIFATLSVIVLVLFALGRREAVVVGAAVIVTLAITLFSSWAWGFTLNRVSLFALIFSIGILVDDAIVVVENIHRHMNLGNKSLTEAIPIAVNEVGGPTILATFTVIAALLPMAFVTGLMGPYMRPIPINASSGMLISLAVAFIFTPWLYRRLFINVKHDHEEHKATPPLTRRLHGFFTRAITPFMQQRKGRRNRLLLLAGILGLIVISVGLVGMQAVIMKMLPFDNKSEFQVIVDMPEGTALEKTHRVLQELADYVETIPEIANYQLYAGAASPINFNGLVRQYYLRNESHMGDIQVNLVDKRERSRKSHDIAMAARPALVEIAERHGANIKVVEVPPGPPVLSPLVAEIYGLDYPRQLEVAGKVTEVFVATDDVIDVDNTIETPQPKTIIAVDRSRAARLGISQQTVASAIVAALAGEDVSYLHDENAKVEVPIRMELAAEQKDNLSSVLALRVRARDENLVALSEVTQVLQTRRHQTIQHKDLLPVVYVTGDVGGRTDSPLYGLAAISSQLKNTEVEEGAILEQYFIRQPENPYAWSMKWDGEWQVTFETFRDMGIAYSLGLIMIYLLVVAMFKSYSVPLIIMAPIPLTLIGILPGHAILGQQFTAPSMIGMIALAGIIVRNSILLVDFIQQEVRSGKTLEDATVSAAAVRSLPIALTALAAMMGGFFILDDPIFGGLAVSLIFGLMVSTALTLIVIPVVYYAYHYKTDTDDQVSHSPL